jgi:hypothetical protein
MIDLLSDDNHGALTTVARCLLAQARVPLGPDPDDDNGTIDEFAVDVHRIRIVESGKVYELRATLVQT